MSLNDVEPNKKAKVISEIVGTNVMLISRTGYWVQLGVFWFNLTRECLNISVEQ